jgi:[acyl-carrier-protein] S-malonyltransferase
MAKRAIVCAGQGAQFVGMGKDLAEAFPACAALFARANEVLGFDLARLCYEGPLEELTKSDNCQPAIFTVSAACVTALRQLKPELSCAAYAGLSLGEWTALYAAGALSFDDALRVLRARGRFMQEACQEQPGGMVSVMGLGPAELEKICAATGVVMANINSPEQIVLSGAKAAVAEAEKQAQAAGAKRTVPLPVAGAFHSPLMASAATRLEAMLKDVTFRAPAGPVVANVTGEPHGGPDEIRRRMVAQVTGSVQWVKSVQRMKADGVTEYVECGPGKVLAGLIKRIDKDAVAHSIQDRATLEKTAPALQG